MGAVIPSIFARLSGSMYGLGAPSAHQTLGVNAGGTAWALRTPAWLDTANTFTAAQAFTTATFTRFVIDTTSIAPTQDLVRSLGTPTARYSVLNTGSIIWGGTTSTAAARAQSDAVTSWIDSTDATRKARVAFSVYDTAAREFLRADATGSGVQVGIGGATHTGYVLAMTGGVRVNNSTAAVETAALTTGVFASPGAASTIRWTGTTDDTVQAKIMVTRGSGSNYTMSFHTRATAGLGSGMVLSPEGYLSLLLTPTYADNAAAVAGGLAANTVFKTATGELRIVV